MLRLRSHAAGGSAPLLATVNSRAETGVRPRDVVFPQPSTLPPRQRIGSSTPVPTRLEDALRVRPEPHCGGATPSYPPVALRPLDREGRARIPGFIKSPVWHIEQSSRTDDRRPPRPLPDDTSARGQGISRGFTTSNWDRSFGNTETATKVVSGRLKLSKPNEVGDCGNLLWARMQKTTHRALDYRCNALRTFKSVLPKRVHNYHSPCKS